MKSLLHADVGAGLIVGPAKLFHEPGLSHLPNASKNQRFPVGAVFPCLQLFEGLSIHTDLLLVSICLVSFYYTLLKALPQAGYHVFRRNFCYNHHIFQRNQCVLVNYDLLIYNPLKNSQESFKASHLLHDSFRWNFRGLPQILPKPLRCATDTIRRDTKRFAILEIILKCNHFHRIIKVTYTY